MTINSIPQSLIYISSVKSLVEIKLVGVGSDHAVTTKQYKLVWLFGNYLRDQYHAQKQLRLDFISDW